MAKDSSTKEHRKSYGHCLDRITQWAINNGWVLDEETTVKVCKLASIQDEALWARK